jgi:hypothetical protein
VLAALDVPEAQEVATWLAELESDVFVSNPEVIRNVQATQSG